MKNDIDKKMDKRDFDRELDKKMDKRDFDRELDKALSGRMTEKDMIAFLKKYPHVPCSAFPDFRN